MSEFTLESNGWSFNVIYGKHINGSFIAIPNWGICVEASSPNDIFYNVEKLRNCLSEIVVENAESIAEQICDMFGK